RLPSSTLFPYTTLFRSRWHSGSGAGPTCGATTRCTRDGQRPRRRGGRAGSSRTLSAAPAAAVAPLRPELGPLGVPRAPRPLVELPAGRLALGRHDAVVIGGSGRDLDLQAVGIVHVHGLDEAVIDRAEARHAFLIDVTLPAQQLLLAAGLEGKVAVEAVRPQELVRVRTLRLVEEGDEVAVAHLEEEVQIGCRLVQPGDFVERQGGRERQAQDVFVEPAGLFRVATAIRDVMRVSQKAE